ncbi:hypothetical protein SEA_COLUCCI_32 [Arthrobacter phage Colucci]|uniref:Uncharacterized protein n=1 Tax=Arthrobacter phage Colucci TaxID=2015834 RepID=A0A286N2U6_9CAUD|nr:hypothetical protein FDI27_gp032 [Arthrobacter phage Colucci]ASX98703.1 hypothetical protein SEA_COLUCCI_32 [Arthrobacter phage Colucci]
MTATPKFPKVHVPLLGEDGNGFMIVGRAMKAMRREGIPKEDIDAFQKEATSGDYSHLLATVQATVNTN